MLRLTKHFSGLVKYAEWGVNWYGHDIADHCNDVMVFGYL